MQPKRAQVTAWLILARDGKVYGMAQADHPNLALAHYVVAGHYGVSHPVDEGFEFADGHVEWRSEWFRRPPNERR